MSRNVLKVGIPGQLDVQWERGSDGNITLTAPDSVDLTGVTSVTALVKSRDGRTVLTLEDDLSQAASGVIVLTLTAEAASIDAGKYVWMMRLNGGPLDSRAVVGGSWHHVQDWGFKE